MILNPETRRITDLYVNNSLIDDENETNKYIYWTIWKLKKCPVYKKKFQISFKTIIMQQWAILLLVSLTTEKRIGSEKNSSLYFIK